MSDFKFIEERRNKIPEETKIFAKMSLDILERIQEILDEKGYTYKDLAASLDKTQPEVSKWINGSQNFTIKTLAKLQAALGEDIIKVPCKRNKLTELRAQTLPTITYPNAKAAFAIYAQGSFSKVTALQSFEQVINIVQDSDIPYRVKLTKENWVQIFDIVLAEDTSSKHIIYEAV